MKVFKFVEEMFGLLLFLIEDEVFRCFEEDDLVFLSCFVDLVLKKWYMFIYYIFVMFLFDIEKEIFVMD